MQEANTTKGIMGRDITAIIPTLNEAKNISWVIQQIINIIPTVKIIISDDESVDGTQSIVNDHHNNNAHITLLDRTQKIHGLTASVIDAILCTKTKYFVVLDGDGQHPPEKIKSFLKSFSEGNELVICTRERVANEWGFYRRLMSKTATTLAKMRLYFNNISCSDPLSGFFGGNTQKIQKIITQNKSSFVPEGYKVLFDLLKSWQGQTYEIPYIFGLRKGGESKIKNKHIIAFLKSVIK